MDIGPLRPADLNVRPEARDIFGEVARFAAPVDIGELFESMSLLSMFWSPEVYAVRVWFCCSFPLYSLIWWYVICLYRVWDADTPFIILSPCRD